MVLTSYAMAQDQATRDAISQQVRDQINAARQEAQAAAKSARAAGAPTAPALPGGFTTIQQIPYNPNDDIPPRAMGLGITLIVALAAVLILSPFTRAIARAIDRSKPRSSAAVPPEISSQLTQLTQAVDAIAVEVERISEGQRFTTRLLSEQRQDASRTLLAPGAGDARPGT